MLAALGGWSLFLQPITQAPNQGAKRAHKEVLSPATDSKPKPDLPTTHVHRRRRGGASEPWKPEPLPNDPNFIRERNDVVDYAWQDENAPLWFRVREFLKRKSWGFNFREAVVLLRREKDGTRVYRPANQKDIADALKAHPSHVCEAVAELKRRGYVEDRNDFIRLSLKPVPNPDRPKRSYTGGPDPKTRWASKCKERITKFGNFTGSEEGLKYLREQPEDLLQLIDGLNELYNQITKNGNSAAFPQTPPAGITHLDRNISAATDDSPATEPPEILVSYVQKRASEIFAERFKRGCDRSIAAETARALKGKDPVRFFEWVHQESLGYHSYGILPKLAAQYADSLDATGVVPAAPPRRALSKDEGREENLRRLEAYAPAPRPRQ
jgi:hypothetical protein